LAFWADCKTDDIAIFAAGPTAVALATWIDIEGGTTVIVERAESFVNLASLPQSQISPNDIDDVIGGLDALDGILDHRNFPLNIHPIGGA